MNVCYRRRLKQPKTIHLKNKFYCYDKIRYSITVNSNFVTGPYLSRFMFYATVMRSILKLASYPYVSRKSGIEIFFPHDW